MDVLDIALLVRLPDRHKHNRLVHKGVAVLQITSYDNCLGTKSNIKDLIENSLAIFISYLKVVYMHQMEHELWVNSMRQFKEVNVDGQKQTS